MALPFFYKEDITTASEEIILDEATSKHMVQVLRMQNGSLLQLTNGNGDLFTCEITDDNRKKCLVKVNSEVKIQRAKTKTTIAISLLKNANRFEWFLEKATEIGVNEIIPLICERTEKTTFKADRLKNILVSAMLQSQQCWLPDLHEPVQFDDWMMKQPARPAGGFGNEGKYIAHCENEENKRPLHLQITKSSNQLICIGPEGDFTKDEIDLALKNIFVPVSLGNTRLRTETAGVVAASLLRLI